MEFFNSLGRLSKLLVKNTNNGGKSGNVVFAARNLYNKITGVVNRFDVACDAPATQSRQINIAAPIVKSSIYPNPNNGSFKIMFENASSNLKQVSVFDIYGKQLFSKKFGTADKTATVDLNLVKGLYFVHTQNSTNGTTTIEKMFVQ